MLDKEKRLVKFHARLFKTHTQQIRLAVYHVLRVAEQSFSSHIENVESERANVSQGLQVMKQAEVVRHRKQGLQVNYGFLNALCGIFCNCIKEVMQSRIA